MSSQIGEKTRGALAHTVEVEGLTKVYPPPAKGGKPVRAVDGLGFAVREGEVFGFLGPNGAGKTTTMRRRCGLMLWTRDDEMCQATVYLGNQDIARDVIWLEPTEDGVQYATFFEGPKVARGRIQHIDFLKHRVLLVPLEGDDERDREAEYAVAALDRAQR